MFETTSDFVWQKIQPRPRDAHKGTFGSVLVVAGSASYRGAAALAVEGALRTGAGIVTLASVEPVLAAVAARLPECCLCPCEAGAEGGISPQNIDRHPAAEGLCSAGGPRAGLYGPERGPCRRDPGTGKNAPARLFRQCSAGCGRPERGR